MNVIIIGIVIIIITSIICYTIYKIKNLKHSHTMIKTEVDSILDKYNKYEEMMNNKDENYWKYSISSDDFAQVLYKVKKYYNN